MAAATLQTKCLSLNDDDRDRDCLYSRVYNSWWLYLTRFFGNAAQNKEQ
ncbi:MULTISPECIES: hypothetical protein [Kamptonema]|nr:MULTISPECIES: hypothetical protein [Kamptonema]